MMRVLKHVCAWLGIFSAALLLLSGRYDWSADAVEYSLKGYLSSAYLLVLTLPATYYLLRYFRVSQAWSCLATATGAVILSLPYRWLSLHQLFYNRNRVAFWPRNIVPALPWSSNWFPQNLHHLRSSPREGLIFLLLTLLGGCVALACWRCREKSGPVAQSRKNIGFWLAIYLLILFQTWLHLGTRSPYLYITAYEQPPAVNNMYTLYLSPEGLHPVNGDYPVFRELEEYFWGRPQPINGMLIRRSYESYLSSQFSYFINPYYVYLGFNVLFWFAACFCAYLFAAPTWGTLVAAIFTLFVAASPGFIMYAGQPMSYTAGYACVMILLYLYERMLGGAAMPLISSCLLYGLILGLGSMVYDMFPLYLVLLLYSWHCGRLNTRHFMSLAFAIAIFLVFVLIQQKVLGLTVSEANSKYLTNSFQTLWALMASGNIMQLLNLICGALGNFVDNMLHAFFVLPALMALASMFCRSDPLKVNRAILLGFGALAVSGFFYLGQAAPLTYMPRFVFIAYPCVYLLAALWIVWLADHAALRWPRLPRHLVPVLAVAPVMFLSNMDVFGFPQLYYWFYYIRDGFFS